MQIVTWIIIGVIVVVLILIIWAYSSRKKRELEEDIEEIDTTLEPISEDITNESDLEETKTED